MIIHEIANGACAAAFEIALDSVVGRVEELVAGTGTPPAVVDEDVEGFTPGVCGDEVDVLLPVLPVFPVLPLFTGDAVLVGMVGVAVAGVGAGALVEVLPVLLGFVVAGEVVAGVGALV